MSAAADIFLFVTPNTFFVLTRKSKQDFLNLNLDKNFFFCNLKFGLKPMTIRTICLKPMTIRTIMRLCTLVTRCKRLPDLPE